jgi:hypothetical protein
LYILKGRCCPVLPLGLLLSLLVTSVGCDGTTPVPSSERSWHVLQENFEDGLLLSVWGSASDEVWIVGGRAGKTVVLHGDQSQLLEVSNPGTAMAWWICGLGEGLAIVGEQGLVMTQTSPGEFASLDVGIESTLYGCWGDSVDDFWIVGGDPLTGPAELAHVQNGQAIAPDLGSLLSELPRVLFKVVGMDEQLFVVGGDGTLLHRDGSGQWQVTRIASATVPLFTVSATSDDDVWAVGGLGSAVVTHFDGEQWQDESPLRLPNLFGVSAVADEVVVAGAFGALAERRNNEWHVIETFSEDTFHSVWLDGEGGSWAVGGNVLEQDPALRHGMIWVR